MEFRQLRSFVEVVRQGSFTQAAQVRHASQSTISKQVAQLEQSLGVQVLERNGPHVRLTDAGAVVFRRAEEMLRLRRDLLSELDDLSQLNRGELRLGLPLLGADALFAQRFAEYRRRYPNIAVHLVEPPATSAPNCCWTARPNRSPPRPSTSACAKSCCKPSARRSSRA